MSSSSKKTCFFRSVKFLVKIFLLFYASWSLVLKAKIKMAYIY
jgi:hypothetical protein